MLNPAHGPATHDASPALCGACVWRRITTLSIPRAAQAGALRERLDDY